MSRYPHSLRVLDHARHRNGICGAPFSVVLFDDGESRKLGILFDSPDHHIARLCCFG
jgi:predicted neutral ceramidase superfamily lipid hydrolase